MKCLQRLGQVGVDIHDLAYQFQEFEPFAQQRFRRKGSSNLEAWAATMHGLRTRETNAMMPVLVRYAAERAFAKNKALRQGWVAEREG